MLLLFVSSLSIYLLLLWNRFELLLLLLILQHLLILDLLLLLLLQLLRTVILRSPLDTIFIRVREVLHVIASIVCVYFRRDSFTRWRGILFRFLLPWCQKLAVWLLLRWLWWRWWLLLSLLDLLFDFQLNDLRFLGFNDRLQWLHFLVEFIF